MKIINEKEITPIHLPGRDVFNLVTPENTGCKRFSIGIDIISKDGGTKPPHCHPKSTEVVYLISGKLKVIDGEGKFHYIRSGDIVYLPPGTVHYFKNVGEKEAKILFCYSPPVKTGEWIEIKKV